MGKSRKTIDWNHIHAFLAVAESGSLSGAARKLGQSQPTLGRHIKNAEAELGAELFTRTATGLRLTQIGQEMLEPARQMARASARFEHMARDHEARFAGTVRITASVVVSHYILPKLITKFREQEPQIQIELLPSDTTQNLIFRDADIALRMHRPTQLDVITRQISQHSLALYAGHELLRKYGQPTDTKELMSMPFVGFDQSDYILKAMQDMGLKVDRTFFDVRCDDQAAFWKLVCAGCGVGAMQTIIGDAEPTAQRLSFQPQLPSLPIWIAAHDAIYQNPRVKRVWRFLSDELSS